MRAVHVERRVEGGELDMGRMRMKILLLTLVVCFAGCMPEPEEDDVADAVEGDAADALSTSLSSICSFVCNNSHGQRSCGDQRSSGQVNVAVAPLLENTTKVPDTILGTTRGWTSTSCPNCQWQLESVTTNELIGGGNPDVVQSTNGVAIVKTVSSSRSYEWAGTVVLRIFDPTDASVGTCRLSVAVSLHGPLL